MAPLPTPTPGTEEASGHGTKLWTTAFETAIPALPTKLWTTAFETPIPALSTKLWTTTFETPIPALTTLKTVVRQESLSSTAQPAASSKPKDDAAPSGSGQALVGGIVGGMFGSVFLFLGILRLLHRFGVIKLSSPLGRRRDGNRQNGHRRGERPVTRRGRRERDIELGDWPEIPDEILNLRRRPSDVSTLPLYEDDAPPDYRSRRHSAPSTIGRPGSAPPPYQEVVVTEPEPVVESIVIRHHRYGRITLPAAQTPIIAVPPRAALRDQGIPQRPWSRQLRRVPANPDLRGIPE